MADNKPKSDVILSVQDLRTYFHTRNGVVKAVDGVSFDIRRGETLGIVGESGSGKSVSCYTVMRLIPTPPGRVESGTAIFDGKVDLLKMPLAELRKVRGDRVTMIFQDPMTCLNPYLRVGEQLMEPLLIHKGMNREDARKKAVQALQEVGIQDAPRRLQQFPHEFSGGMRQRVMIAMALITEPELLIADEPTTALDVTVQAQILDLIKKLQREKGTAVIFVTHDLGVISGMADRVLVMYAGRAVETGLTRDVFYNPQHPYTQALIDSIPASHAPGEELFTIRGLPPDVSKPLPGCAFSLRCSHAEESCRTTDARIREMAGAHGTACTRVQAGSLKVITHRTAASLAAGARP
jgi:oligopeptide transport system ATP-binding protein